LGASERDEEKRGDWRERVRALDPKRLVFVDECSTNIALTRLYARAPRGERVYGKVPRNWGKNITLIASLSTEGVGAAMSVEEPTDAVAFAAYLKHLLAPTLKKGHIVVMDNLQVHKSRQVRQLIEGAGAEILFLPPYSPDFSPIEEVFSKEGQLAPGRGPYPRSPNGSDRTGP
jgi:DDE superfamily endonuclease